MSEEQKLINQLKNPFLFKLAMIKSLPMIWIAGIKITDLNPNQCSVKVKYGYITKNPFRSIYFACLSMAAELSTGVLALIKINSSQKNISMLVTGVNAQFHKKATGKITFTCIDGAKFQESIKQAIETKEGQILETTSIGVDESGQIVANFQFQWSFKVKN